MGAAQSVLESKAGGSEHRLRGSAGQNVMVLCGPVVGSVTDTAANVLLEVDEPADITIILTPDGRNNATIQRLSMHLKERKPAVFELRGLMSDTHYAITFEGLDAAQADEIAELQPSVKTFKRNADITDLRVVAFSCDQPRRLLSGEENPYGRIAALMAAPGGVDMVLHLGDQVYTKMDGFLDRAYHSLDNYNRPNLSAHARGKIIEHATEELRRVYRYTWSQHLCAQTLAKSSHYMIWSDNDVANDFTEIEYPKEFVQCGMNVYTEYQRQLWDPACKGVIPATHGGNAMEEWHFQHRGGLGMFMVDMRGNRISADGRMIKTEELREPHTLMSEKQKKALEAAFATPGVSCMFVCSEIPFVSGSPEKVRKLSKKIKFLEGHWAYHEAETAWLYNLCFSWKAAAPPGQTREVVLLGGDIHVGVESVLIDKTTGATIKSITASPITNHVCAYFEDPEGDFNERYAFKNKPLPSTMRNYCVVELKFSNSGSSCTQCLIRMEQIPTGGDGKDDH